mgnify:CR=1 FL=1
MNRKKSKQFIIAGLLIFFFVSLFNSVSQSAESTADVSADDALKEKIRQQILGESVTRSVEEEYTIGYRDILHISVYGEGSMAVSEGLQAEAAANVRDRENIAVGGGFIRGRGSGVEVRIDGRISLRHIGDVSVVGMTLTQLADYLKQLYSTIYEDPILTVTLVQSNSQQYTIMGQVLNPGLFHLDYPLTIVKAVARAGGFTEWANSDITVIRQNSSLTDDRESGGNKGKTYKFDYDDFLKGQNLEKNILIKPGDVIVVH